MQLKKWKILIRLLFVFLISVVFIGCGKDKDTLDNQSVTNTQENVSEANDDPLDINNPFRAYKNSDNSIGEYFYWSNRLGITAFNEDRAKFLNMIDDAKKPDAKLIPLTKGSKGLVETAPEGHVDYLYFGVVENKRPHGDGILWKAYGTLGDANKKIVQGELQVMGTFIKGNLSSKYVLAFHKNKLYYEGSLHNIGEINISADKEEYHYNSESESFSYISPKQFYYGKTLENVSDESTELTIDSYYIIKAFDQFVDEGLFISSFGTYYFSDDVLFNNISSSYYVNDGRVKLNVGPQIDIGSLKKLSERHILKYYDDGILQYDMNGVIKGSGVVHEDLLYGKQPSYKITAKAGTIYYPNGKIKYQGELNEFLKPNGYGVFYKEDGTKDYEGVWKNGNYDPK